MNLNTNVIADILQKTPTAENFATYAACRERNARDGVSKIKSIRAQMEQEKFHPVTEDLLLMFRELERAGVGQLKGDTFKWNVSIKTIGELAEQTSVVKAKTASRPTYQSPIPGSYKSLAVYFDTKREIEIRFSVGLTKDEAKLALEKLLQQCE